MSAEQFKEILTQDIDKVLEWAERIQIHHLREQSKLSVLLSHDKRGAFYSLLIRLSNSFGEKFNKYIHITLDLKHHEIGQLLGLTRETVTRFFMELRSLGIVSEDQGGHLIIHNLS